MGANKEEWRKKDAPTDQQQIRVLYAPAHYLRPTDAAFLATVKFNVPFLPNQEMRVWLENCLELIQYFEDAGKVCFRKSSKMCWVNSYINPHQSRGTLATHGIACDDCYWRFDQ